MADKIVSTGMKDAGYRYVVIDVGWQEGRDGSGNFTVNSQRFPSGIKSLADYIHGKGLKFGLYTDAGRSTCIDGKPGSLGHESQDAAKFAEWTVDFVKADWCGSDGLNAREVYTVLGNALHNASRPIVFSLCEWGYEKVWEWAAPLGHMWRISGDIKDCWDCSPNPDNTNPDPRGLLSIIDWSQRDAKDTCAAPGGWNDPDMLEVGNSGLSITESRMHFSLWCIMAAPLIAGNDLRSMSDSILQILTNAEVVTVDQDSLGVQGKRVKKDGDLEIWAKPLRDSSKAVVLFNRSGSQISIACNFTDVGLSATENYSVRDLWQKKGMGEFKGSYSAQVPSHGVVMIRVWKEKITDVPGVRVRSSLYQNHSKLFLTFSFRGSTAGPVMLYDNNGVRSRAYFPNGRLLKQASFKNGMNR
jgi:alpha-galactosidase